VAGALTLSGVALTAGQFISLADLAAGRLIFTPAANANGAGYASFTFQVQDDGGGADLDTLARSMTIDVSAVNDVPVLTTNSGLAVNQGTAAVITNTLLQASDIDSSAAQLLFTISSGPIHGTLELTTMPGAAITSFTQTDVDTNRLVYIHDDSFTTADAFTFTLSDGAGGAIGSTTFAIDIKPVNHAPSNSVPGTQMMVQGTSLVFSTANGNAISIGDADAGANPVQVTLTARDGWITLGSTVGLTFSVGTGVHDTTVTFVGTVANINAALARLVYTPGLDYSGTTIITLSTDDLGNTGLGGRQSAGAMVAINVAAPAVMPAMGGSPVSGVAGGVPVSDPIALSRSDGGASTPSPKSFTLQDSTPALAGSGEREPLVALDAQGVGSTQGSSASDFSRVALQLADAQHASREYRYLLTAFLPEVSPLVFGPGNPPEDMLVLASADGSVLSPARIQSVQDPAMLDALNEMRRSLSEEGRLEGSALAIAAAATLGLSVGYVIWLLRGGVLVSSLLSSLPAWRLVDPLPILGRLDDDEDSDEAADDTLESLVARTNVLGTAQAAGGMATSLVGRRT
jgi:hypothetical protein